VKNPAQWPEAPSPWRVEDLLVMVPTVHDMFSQQKIQMVMAVLMDQVVNQIQVATIKTIDERQPRAMPITETDHPLRLKRNNARSE
jgi:hypothetical protein